MHAVYLGCESFVSPTNDEGWRYNDNTWHQMIAWRDKGLAYVSIDGVFEGLIILLYFHHCLITVKPVKKTSFWLFRQVVAFYTPNI